MIRGFVPLLVQGIIFKRQLPIATAMAGPSQGRGDEATYASAYRRMRDVNKNDEPQRQGKSPKRPEWAAGLRQLYDSVVEEPLPDSFNDLLSKLDSKDL